jgi:DNA adenine methylase
VSSTAYFTSYSLEGFDLGEQERLRDTCLELDEKGVFFVLSNSYAKVVRELYTKVKNFEVYTVQAPRMISSKASTRGHIKEILVTNIPKEISKKKSLEGFL